MTIIWQAIQAIWSGMIVGFKAFFSALPIYDAISGIQDQIWAAFLGVPVIVISIGGILISSFKLVAKILK
ncbi:MAG: hypothetical protein E7175_03225 [Erysipelotrichaceae bacterium]|nr:hypothetical protein [Erysipelotrichaceae bacterium]